MRAPIFILFISFLFNGFSQDSIPKQVLLDSNMIQLSGVVISEGTLDPLAFTTVYDKTQERGMISDYYGYFSLIVFPGDTLLFSYFGYKTSSYIVSDTLSVGRYSMIHMIQKDTLNLPEVTVYPWPSREDFARAFVEMQPDDAIRKAQRELSGESLAFIAARIEGDASLSYGTANNARYTKIYTNNQLPANNLFNPYAWAKLISEWKKGNLARE